MLLDAGWATRDIYRSLVACAGLLEAVIYDPLHLIAEENRFIDRVDDNRLCFIDRTREQLLGELIQHLALNDSFHWTGTKLGIKSCLGNAMQPFIGILQRDATFGKQLPHPFELKTHDLFDLAFLKRSKDNNLVDTV